VYTWALKQTSSEKTFSLWIFVRSSFVVLQFITIIRFVECIYKLQLLERFPSRSYLVLQLRPELLTKNYLIHPFENSQIVISSANALDFLFRLLWYLVFIFSFINAWTLFSLERVFPFPKNRLRNKLQLTKKTVFLFNNLI